MIEENAKRTTCFPIVKRYKVVVGENDAYSIFDLSWQSFRKSASTIKQTKSEYWELFLRSADT